MSIFIYTDTLSEKLKNCNIADIDEDEYGLQEIRIQLEEEK